MFGKMSPRLLRESWDGTTPVTQNVVTGEDQVQGYGATLLSQEIYAMFQDDIPLEHSAPIIINQNPGTQALTVNGTTGLGTGPALVVNGASTLSGASTIGVSSTATTTGSQIILQGSSIALPPVGQIQLGAVSGPVDVSSLSVLNLTPLSTQFGNMICNGRLSLSNTDAVNVAGGTGTTVYFLPFCGSHIGLYDGTSTWNILSFSSASISVPATSGMYDVFAYNNSGVVALELSAKWTTDGSGTGADGTRAAALAKQNGIYVKSGATTRRYLGSFFSSSGTVYDTVASRGLWSYYNRIPKKVVVNIGNTSWTYTVNATWRAMDNDSNNAVAVVVGVSETPIRLKSSVNLQAPDGANSATAGIGYDSTTVNSADLNGILGFVASFRDNAWASLEHVTNIGLHVYYALEQVVNVGGSILINFYSSGAQSYASCGISGTFWC